MNDSKSIIFFIARWALPPLLMQTAQAAEQPPHAMERIEEIVVTAPFQQTEAETALPIGILDEEALRERAANTLGDTLKHEIGVTSASFGAGVGQPVIRGQSGNRVGILQNGTVLVDAARLSPDHANGVEAVLADRIEILRGPSTLLYGSGAIGGVVNVIDARVPERLIGRPSLVVEQSRNSVNEEDRTVVRLDASSGNVGFHFDAFRRESGNVEVSGFAIDEEALEALEELRESLLEEEHHDEEEHDHDEDGHEEEEIENTHGFVGNSNAEADGATAGFSYFGDRGFFGFSVARLRNDYGLPPGTHDHAHEEEEEHHDEDEDEHHEEEEGLLVRLDMDQTRYDFKGRLDFRQGFFESLGVDIGLTDYEHKEIEIEPDGARHVGTVYSHEGLESRLILRQRPRGDWDGVWGLQFAGTEFSAAGEEAFIPLSDLGQLGLFTVHRYSDGPLTGELGMRVERNTVDPVGRCEAETTSISLSGSVLYDIDDEANLLVGVARSERGPTVEERYSNVSAATCLPYDDEHDYVLHAATALLEVGNPLLEKETSSNLEVGLRRHSGPVFGEISAYYNQVDDFIYLDLAAEEIDEQPVARYLSGDATFHGLEAELDFELAAGAGHRVTLGFFGDMVRARLDAGGDVPRIPPSKLGARLRWTAGDWTAHFHVTRVGSQDRTGPLELATGGYTLASLYADRHWRFGPRAELQLFASADNLLDEEVRNHASLLKNYSPEAGRGVRVGLRLRY